MENLEFMQLAIDEAKRSVLEKGKTPQQVEASDAPKYGSPNLFGEKGTQQIEVSVGFFR